MKMGFSQHTRMALSTGAVLFSVLFLLFGFALENWVDIDARKADSLNWRVSMALAYSSVLMLVVTLSIGPLAVIRRRTNPVHNPLRRAFGVGAALFGLAHLLIAITIHAEGWALWWQFVRYQPESWLPLAPRVDTHGIANHLGLLQAALFVLLLVLSTHRAIRRLGLPLWKRLQRLTYPLLLAILAHGLLYQRIEERDGLIRALFLLIFLLVMGLQIAGLWVRWRTPQRD
jgi:DMSO/TMAO reductase YedYZ heme-binding membrane subunit